jgi:hypothetical protein
VCSWFGGLVRAEATAYGSLFQKGQNDFLVVVQAHFLAKGCED